MKKVMESLVALIVFVAVANVPAAAEIISPNLDNETYTIDGTSGNGSVSGTSVLTGTVTLKQGFFVEYLVVGGGGGGGATHGGGGGAGGYLEGTSYPVNAQSYTVVVGNFGAGAGTGVPGYTGNTYGQNGQNSQFGAIVAYGGGGGASRNWLGTLPDGGSGGGNADFVRDAGNPIDPTQGNDGGVSGAGSTGGGGGGAADSGGVAVSDAAGAGGAGKTSAITGFETGYAGGGGGGAQHSTRKGGSATHGGGSGGDGGGITGAPATVPSAVDGSANTGGGGGGGSGYNTTDPSGGNGGSGIVVVRYKGTTAATGGTIAENPGSATGYTVHTFSTVDSGAFNLSGVVLNARLGATVTGDLSGSGSLVYDGPGTLTLAGANTYTGDTTVKAGTLVLGSTGELRFALNDGGLSNQIAGDGGILILDGTLRLDSSALTDLDGVWNLIDLGTFGVGNLTFDDDFALALVGEPDFANLGGGLYSYLSGKSLWEFSASTGGLTLTQIPEPTSLALLGLGALALLKRRHRSA